MKITHKVFGKVTVGAKRITTGGHDVYDATDEKGVERVLLTASRYWENQ
jgi:hypothetical protein